MNISSAFLTVITIITITIGSFFVRNLIKDYDSQIINLNNSQQTLLEINYQLENVYGVAKKELARLENNLQAKNKALSLQEKLTSEQQKLITVQEKISTQQNNSIQDLQTNLGGAKTEIEKLKKTGGEPLPKDFINSLLQATLRIKCLVAKNGDMLEFSAGSGSILGRYSAVNNKEVIMTNAHVAKPNSITGAFDCSILSGENVAYKATVVRRVAEANYDFAFLSLGEPIDKNAQIPIISYENLGIGFCESSEVAVGDLITILSFPKFVGPENAVSTGAISDILEGPIYEASAIIDSGSSGGVAILNKKQCVLGMPTWKGLGTKLGLSYIQSWPMMLNYR